MRFDRKIAVITGASKGIGKAVAIRLANEGATVVINYGHSSLAADSLASELSKQGLSATAFRADVSKAAERLALIDHVMQAFGRIDILVSNAGIDHFGVAQGWCHAVSLGHLFIANPDLPMHWQRDAGLNEPHQTTFYGGGKEGYTDYPCLPFGPTTTPVPAGKRAA